MNVFSGCSLVQLNKSVNKSLSPSGFLGGFLFLNFMSVLKNQSSVSKAVCGFYITLILNGNMTF